MSEGRFGRLEIPADRLADLSYLDAPLSVPRPLPVEEHVIAAFVDGRAYVAGDVGEDAIHLYDLRRPLVALVDPEAAWRARHGTAFATLAASVRSRVPVGALTDEHARRLARDALSARLPDEIPDGGKALGRPLVDSSALLRVVGHARLLRLCDKLYDLVTLPEYAKRFAKAIDPAVMAELAALPITAPPAEFLDLIARRLDKIHPKARSPLRNKMDTTRVVLGGVTLLPIYAAPVRGLFDRYAERLADEVRASVFA